MTRPPCGTTAAQRRHRRNGSWPCETCIGVVIDVKTQLGRRDRPAIDAILDTCPWVRLTSIPAEELARAVLATGVTDEQAAHILGLKVTHLVTLAALLAVRDERGAA